MNVSGSSSAGPRDRRSTREWPQVSGAPSGEPQDCGGAVPFAGNERFAVQRCLGAGGMGVVYEVLDRETGRKLALKTLERQDPSRLARLKAEFRLVAGIVHHNLVHLRELHADEHGAYFTMELVEGMDLRSWVRQAELGPDAEEEGVRRLRDAAAQLASALSALHESGRIHLDVKPSNVLVDGAGRAVLLDFGLCRSLRRGEPGGELPERPGGTPAYMAPEQLFDGAVGPAADWYAFGATLYELICGDVPFAGREDQIVRAKLRGEPPEPLARLAPSAPSDIASLAEDLLAPEPEDRPDHAEVQRRLGLLPPPPGRAGPLAPERAGGLFGRDGEQDALRRSLDIAATGGRAVVQVEGLSGIGKSALLRTFCEEARHRGCLVLSGACFEREWIPFKALDGVVERIVTILQGMGDEAVQRTLPDGAVALARTFPALLRLRAFRGASRAAELGSGFRSAAFDALADLLRRLADGRPIVLAVDDAQWSDADSDALLRHLLGADLACGLLLVLVRRPCGSPGAEALVQGLPGGIDVRRIELGPISPEAALLAAHRLLRRTPAPRHVVEAIARESGGVPLWLEQLGLDWQRNRDGPGPRNGLTLDLLLDGAVRLVDADASRILGILAVAERPLSLPLLQEIAGQIDLLRGVDQLAQLGLALSADGPAGKTVACRHARVGETALCLLAEDDRRGVHLDLGEALLTRQGDPEEIARHLLAAGDTERGVRFALQGATLAWRALAFDRAARLLEEVIGLERDPARRSTLREQLAEVLANDARGQEAAQAYLAAVEEAEPARADRLLHLGAEQLMRSGQIDRGRELLERLLRGRGMRLPRSPAAALLSLWWHRLRLSVRGLAFVPADPADVPPDALTRADALWSAAVTLGLVDSLTAAAFQAQGLRHALAIGEPARVARSLCAEAVFRAVFGGATQAERIWRQASTLVRQSGNAVDEGHLQLSASVMAYQEANWRSSHSAATSSIEALRGRRANLSWIRSTAVVYKLAAAGHLGLLAALAEELPRELSLARTRGDLHAVLHLSLGMPVPVAAILDRPGAGLVEARQAWDASPGRHYAQLRIHALRTEVELLLYLGQADAALGAAREGWTLVRRSTSSRVQIVRETTRELLARAELAAAAATGLDPARARLLRKSAAALERVCGDWGRGCAALVRSQAAAIAGRREDALPWAEEAVRRFQAGSMLLYGAGARWLRAGLVGGAEGERERAEVVGWLEGQGVGKPELLLRMIAPGVEVDG